MPSSSGRRIFLTILGINKQPDRTFHNLRHCHETTKVWPSSTVEVSIEHLLPHIWDRFIDTIASSEQINLYRHISPLHWTRKRTMAKSVLVHVIYANKSPELRCVLIEICLHDVFNIYMHLFYAYFSKICRTFLFPFLWYLCGILTWEK